MEAMLPSRRGCGVVPGKTLTRTEEGPAASAVYCRGRSRACLLGENASRRRGSRLDTMRTDRGWRRFYATGWLVSAGIALVVFRMWQVHVHEGEGRAQEARRTPGGTGGRRAPQGRPRIAPGAHDSFTPRISVVAFQGGGGP